MEGIVKNQYYEAYTRDSLAVIRFKGDIFELLTDVDQSQELMEFIRKSESDKLVRGLIFFNEPVCLGEEAYEKFIRRIMKDTYVPEESEAPQFAERITRFRQINILGRFIRFLSNYQKLFITGIDCSVVTPFIGVLLVADFRLASPDTYFSLAHRKYGLHPSGAIPFLFPYYTGYGKTIELQLSDRIDAGQAFKLGLINQILPSDHFEENCIRYVQPYLKGCPSTLRMTRRLNSYRFRRLEDYLEFEASLLNL
jgi:enoyl-CoA hydratase/carnithine racemase